MIFVWPLIFVFVLLDLSTAFNTVDLDFFLQPLEHTIDIKAITLQWFELYLRLKFVHANGESFSYASGHYGVPQGSVLEPVLFTLYRQYEGKIYIFTSMQMIPRFHPWSQMTHTTLYPSPEWRQYFWFGLQGNLKCIIPLRINGLLLCQQLIIAVIFKRKKWEFIVYSIVKIVYFFFSYYYRIKFNFSFGLKILCIILWILHEAKY